jgi:hypothetical protein
MNEMSFYVRWGLSILYDILKSSSVSKDARIMKPLKKSPAHCLGFL